MTFAKYDQVLNMSLGSFIGNRGNIHYSYIIQNTLDSTQHEDNNTNLLKMTSNV